MAELGELEAAVMDAVWSADQPVSVRDVMEWLTPDRPLAYTTIMTTMDRLHRKGWLRRTQVGRAYLYQAVNSREQHSARLMAEALGESGDPELTLLHFVGTMPAGQAATLRTLLARRPRLRSTT